MNRISVALNLILLFAVIILSYRSCFRNPGPIPPSTTCRTCYPFDCNIPFIPLSAAYVKNLLSNYRTNQWSVINAGLINGQLGNNLIDSRSVWFDLNTLKRFIYEMEARTCSSCDTQPKLGLRVYYGQYTSTGTVGVNAQYDGLHTVAMIPTISKQINGNLYNVDFDPRYMQKCVMADYDCEDSTIFGLLPNIDVTAMNHGDLIPPPGNYSTDPSPVIMKCVDAMDGFSMPTNFRKLSSAAKTK